MGQKIIRISPSFFKELFTIGNVIGQNKIVRVVEGLPQDAKFLRAWWEITTPAAPIVLLFESEEWPDATEGAMYGEARIMVTTEAPEPIQ